MIPAVLVALAVVMTAATGRAAMAASRRGTVVHRLPRSSGSPGPGDEPGEHPGPGPGAGRRALPEPPPTVATALAAAALPVPPPVAWTAWLAALALVPAVAVLLGGLGLAGVALLGVGAVPALVVRSRRGAAEARLETALPGALEAVARSLRSGASLRQAVEEAGTARASGPQLGAELARAGAEAAQGASLVSALEGVAARRPLPGVRLGVAALCLGAETGGAQARAVDGVAATVRERLAVAAELRALSSQARISALVIGLAPVGFGAFAAATDPRTSQFLLHTSAGIVLLTAGLTLDGLGWLWMQRLAQVAL